jgi:hypothetical protein
LLQGLQCGYDAAGKVMHKHRYIRYALGLAGCAALGLAVALWRLGLAPGYAYLVSINILALVLYGYDKREFRRHLTYFASELSMASQVLQVPRLKSQGPGGPSTARIGYGRCDPPPSR